LSPPTLTTKTPLRWGGRSREPRTTFSAAHSFRVKMRNEWGTKSTNAIRLLLRLAASHWSRFSLLQRAQFDAAVKCSTACCRALFAAGTLWVGKSHHVVAVSTAQKEPVNDQATAASGVTRVFKVPVILMYFQPGPGLHWNRARARRGERVLVAHLAGRCVFERALDEGGIFNCG